MKPPGITSQINQAGLNDSAVSALIGVILIVALVLILTAVISVVFLGFISGVPLQKTAYIAAEAKYNTQYGYPLVSLYNKAGDTGLLSGTGSGYPITVLISTTDGSANATPDPENLKWAPGTFLFIIRTDTGYTITDDPDRITGTPLAFPGNDITVTIIDTVENVLIYNKKITAGNSGNVTTTTTSTVTITTTPTPTATVTPTPTVSTNKIMIIWSPATYGYASLSPPEPLTNSRAITVPTGSSKTIYFIPNAGKAVLTIKLDGTTVYSGSSTGSTIEYTILNVVEDRILRATFG